MPTILSANLAAVLNTNNPTFYTTFDSTIQFAVGFTIFATI